MKSEVIEIISEEIRETYASAEREYMKFWGMSLVDAKAQIQISEDRLKRLQSGTINEKDLEFFIDRYPEYNADLLEMLK